MSEDGPIRSAQGTCVTHQRSTCSATGIGDVEAHYRHVVRLSFTCRRTCVNHSCHGSRYTYHMTAHSSAQLCCGAMVDGRISTKPRHQPRSPTPPPCAAACGGDPGSDGDRIPSTLHGPPPHHPCARPPPPNSNVSNISGTADRTRGPVGTARDDDVACGRADSDREYDLEYWEWKGGTDADGIGGLRAARAASPMLGLRPHHRPFRGRVYMAFAYVFTYAAWLLSAAVTFSDLPFTASPRARMRRKRAAGARRSSRAMASSCRGRADAKCARRTAVAPPIVGRRRMCRRRPIVGLRRVLRLSACVSLPRPRRRCPSRPRGRTLRPRGSRSGRRMETNVPHGELRHGDHDPLETHTENRSGADACRAAMGTLTIGQAANPGPPEVLRWISTVAASALAYALPGKQGFHGVHTAGHPSDLDPPRDPFVLRLATANTTGWRPLQEFLRRTDANVVFGQEHRLMADAVPAASAWARKQGWKSVWAPAKKGVGGGASAGTVIFAKAFMGLRHPDKGKAIVAEGHAVAAVVEPPSCRPFIGYAGYFHHGQGLSRTNLALAAEIGSHWESQEDETLQMILGADFNMSPDVFARAGLAKRVWGRVVAPTGARGTCRTRNGSTTYDYYYMSAAMAELVDDIVAVEGTGIRTHAPVVASFLPRLTALKALALRAPPSLPLDEVFGPRPPPRGMRSARSSRSSSTSLRTTVTMTRLTGSSRRRTACG